MLDVLTMLARWALVAVLAGCAWGAWRIEQQWRPMIRGYLERRVGQRLPEPTAAVDMPGRVRFPAGDNVRALHADD